MRIRVPALLLVSLLVAPGFAAAALPAVDEAITGPLAIDWLATDDAAGSVLPGHAWSVDWKPAVPTPVDPLHVTITGATADQSTTQTAPQAATTARPLAFEYSDAYNTRRKIHFYASFATLPLFVTQYVLGDKLYDGTASDGERSAHSAIATSMGVLFGINAVTGVWNLWEARKDPNRRARRTWHGILMLGASAGFVATGALAPDSEDGELEGDRSTHRTVALTSMGVATASYLIMLFSR